jgi:hypothetical protein
MPALRTISATRTRKNAARRKKLAAKKRMPRLAVKRRTPRLARTKTLNIATRRTPRLHAAVIARNAQNARPLAARPTVRTARTKASARRIVRNNLLQS